MQTAALLELGRACPRGLQAVERPRGLREMPERIEVRAAHRLRPDDARQLVRLKTQRPGAVPHLLRRLAEDHRPLVQTEATEGRRALTGQLQQVQQPGEKLAALRRKRGKI